MLLSRLLFYSLLIISLTSGHFASANDEIANTDVPTESSEEIREFAEVVEDPVAVERQLDVEIQLKKASYHIPAIVNNEVMQEFSKLDAETQQRFLEKRIMYLIIMTKTLNVLKYGIGTGSLIKNKLTFKKKKSDDGETPEERAEIQKLTFKLRSHNAVVNILKGFDKFMWSKPEFVAQSNELGTAFSANLVGFGDYKKFKKGGAVGLGFSIGVNIEKKAIVFQIFRDVEKYRSSLLKACGMIGVVFKGPAAYFVGDNQKLYHTQGKTFYPPVAPIFYTETPTKYITGPTWGATLPPSPLGDVLTYTMDYDDKSLFKMEFSAVNKYFVQVHSMNPSEMFKFSAFPVNQVLMSLRYRSTMSCGRLFN